MSQEQPTLTVAGIAAKLNALGIEHNFNADTAPDLVAIMDPAQFKGHLFDAEQGNQQDLSALKQALSDAGLLVAPTPTDGLLSSEASAMSDAEIEAAPASEPELSQGKRTTHHVYGGKAALTFEMDKTIKGIRTLALDGALLIKEKKYDWKNKVRVQLTPGELPIVLAALLRLPVKCSFNSHGENKDKGFSIEYQADRNSFFVKVQGKNKLCTVPMTKEDAFYATQLLLEVMQETGAYQSATDLINHIRALYA